MAIYNIYNVTFFSKFFSKFPSIEREKRYKFIIRSVTLNEYIIDHTPNIIFSNFFSIARNRSPGLDMIARF